MSTSEITPTSVHPHYRTGTWRLDPVHSELSFSVRHMAISRVRGTFRSFDVTVVTAEDPADSTVEATIDVASVDTGQEKRDGHLRTSDFFKVDEFPTATFRSTAFEVDGDAFTLHGDLTLRGVTKPIVLAGEFGGLLPDDENGRHRAGASATTTINRQDFGVSWNAALEAGGVTLGDDIAITADLQVLRDA